MEKSGPYGILKAMAILMIGVGGFVLLGHLAGQIREGAGSVASLWGGLGGMILGIVVLVLADLGARLKRIEAKLATRPADDLSPEGPTPSEGD